MTRFLVVSCGSSCSAKAFGTLNLSQYMWSLSQKTKKYTGSYSCRTQSCCLQVEVGTHSWTVIVLQSLKLAQILEASFLLQRCREPPQPLVHSSKSLNKTCRALTQHQTNKMVLCKSLQWHTLATLPHAWIAKSNWESGSTASRYPLPPA